jgi:hypothetical protein
MCFWPRLICIIPVADARAIIFLIYSNVCVISNANQQINIFRCVMKAGCGCGLKSSAGMQLFWLIFEIICALERERRSSSAMKILLFAGAKTHKTHRAESVHQKPRKSVITRHREGPAEQVFFTPGFFCAPVISLSGLGDSVS